MRHALRTGDKIKNRVPLTRIVVFPKRLPDVGRRIEELFFCEIRDIFNGPLKQHNVRERRGEGKRSLGKIVL